MAMSALVVAGSLFISAASAGVTASVQRLGYCGGDDWEPSVTADALGHVYVLITHFAGNTACDPASGLNDSRIMIQVSDDGGKTFGAPADVSSTPGGISYPKQADPSITVDPTTGVVYVAFLAYGFSGGHTDIYVAKSTDLGQTFSPGVQVNARGCKNCDHEKVLANGNDVYVAYDQGQNHFVAVSKDGGSTFAQHLVDSTYNVAFAEGGALDPHGNAWFAWADCESSSCAGVPAVDFRVSETLAGTGATTFSPVIGQSPQGPACVYTKCGFAYFSPQDAIAIDGAGTVYLAWQEGQVHTQRGSPPIINLSRCAANCLTSSGWSLASRIDDKTASGCPGSACYALFPNIAAGGAGQVYATWIDDRYDSVDGVVDHIDGWNLWYRASTNGGSSWTTAGQKISQFDPAQSQSTPNGFLFPYGDYTGIVLDSACATPAPLIAWGEGHNWAGGPAAPGHIEFASLC
jgi:hypothetical protein